MIVDSSALVAIIRGEPERDLFRATIDSAPRLRMSAGNFLETAIVVDRSDDPNNARRLDELIDATSIEISQVTEQQVRLARQAYRDFGEGSGHRAQLNFGDCFANALAVDTGEALLFKGEHFVHTGVRPAL